MDELESIYELETFEAGGRELFQGLRDVRDPADVEALVTEACRVKDRLDRLHGLATCDSEEWATVECEPSGEMVLKINGVLRELRQSEIVFKQLLAEIARRRAEYDSDDDDGEGGLSDL